MYAGLKAQQGEDRHQFRCAFSAHFDILQTKINPIQRQVNHGCPRGFKPINIVCIAYRHVEARLGICVLLVNRHTLISCVCSAKNGTKTSVDRVCNRTTYGLYIKAMRTHNKEPWRIRKKKENDTSPSWGKLVNGPPEKTLAIIASGPGDTWD